MVKATKGDLLEEGRANVRPGWSGELILNEASVGSRAYLLHCWNEHGEEFLEAGTQRLSAAEPK